MHCSAVVHCSAVGMVVQWPKIFALLLSSTVYSFSSRLVWELVLCDIGRLTDWVSITLPQPGIADRC